MISVDLGVVLGLMVHLIIFDCGAGLIGHPVLF